MKQNFLRYWINPLIFLILFMILHFAYDFFPSPWIAVFSGRDEAFYTHARIGIFAYILLSTGEYLLRRAKIQNRHHFWAARMLALLIMPWIMFTIWYTAPALLGRPMPNDLLEIIYAILTTLLLGGALQLLAREFEKITFSRNAIYVISALVAIMLLQAVLFTYRLPWAGFFTEAMGG